nr:MAG TPA: ATPase [Bacteriophage sp.]
MRSTDLIVEKKIENVKRDGTKSHLSLTVIVFIFFCSMIFKAYIIYRKWQKSLK